MHLLHGSLQDMVLDYVTIILELFVVNAVLSLMIIFLERKKPISTLLWVFSINFLPGIGFLLYLILGQDLSKSKMFRKKRAEDERMHEFAQGQLKALEEGRFARDEPLVQKYVGMVEMFNRAENEVLTRKNSVKIFEDGHEKFRRLFEDLKAAKESIFVQYYIFKSDGLGTEFMDILKEKAREGLTVHLLVDGMGARGLKLKDRRALKEAGVDVAIFFPGILPRINTHMNFRNHRKLVVIDGHIGYLGGFNVGDEYIGKDPRFGKWRDTHLRIVGPAVSFLQWRFFLDFRFASEEGEKAIPPSAEPPREGDVPMCIVTSGPDTKANAIRNGYDEVIRRAEREIYIQTPYFVPDDGLLYSLKIALLRGVKVHIMIPKKRDHPFVHWASVSFLGELLELGAEVYMYTGGFLHTKLVFADDEVAGIGTANFDIRSFELNFEVNAFIFDEKTVSHFRESFWKDVKESESYTYQDYMTRSIPVRVKESVSRLLSPVL